MKILFDASQIRTGGGIQAALAIFRNLAKHKPFIYNCVCSFELAEEMQAHGLFAEEFMTRLPQCGGTISRFKQPGRFLPELEAAFKPDLVYTIFGPAYWKASTRHLVGFAMAHYIYPEYRPGHDKGFFARFVERAAYDLKGMIQVSEFKKADFLVAETATVRERLIRLHGMDPSHIFVVRNSYSPQFKENLGDVESEVNPDRVRRIFIPSSYYPHKNLEMVPDLAVMLKARLPFAFQFVFTLDDASWEPLIRKARSLGVEDCMTTMGKVYNRDIARVYQTADVVFLPTFLECSTAVYPESFMSRRPVVTSDLDFARELCGDAAAFCDPYSPKHCAEQLCNLLEDEELSQSIVEEGERQLLKAYPNPEEKWQAQLALINQLAT